MNKQNNKTTQQANKKTLTPLRPYTAILYQQRSLRKHPDVLLRT